MNTNTRSIVRSIIQHHVSMAFEGQAIPRQSTTTRQVSGGGTVVIRGETNLSGGSWATYQGHLGEWVATINHSGRVGQPGVTVLDALGVA